MWGDVELRDLQGSATRLLEQVQRSESFERVREQVLVAQDLDEDLVTTMASQLVRSFRMYCQPRHLKPEAYIWEERAGGRVARIRPLSAIRFYWAGAEVHPYVPQTVWGEGAIHHSYSETESDNQLDFGATNFDSCGGFELGALGDALLELAEDEEIRRRADAYVPLKKLLVVRSLQCARMALQRAVGDEAFGALPRVMPFQFFATPGHDAPSCLLLDVR
ncbi:hypothetical protein JY651_34450 [Pyxidicoccus parkwayensis]|uniref:Uncharacterized protein n=1 Tax=Pyxidicoccus parkwayensis TaxID=2813578 RepID=A0ABX7NNH5_9BACT|nr:hypothetical protein [Pyxidicoccus parkwaysis]QSQ20330.1 hypothetical protein JY651_34450 [Pyxidicoccus parkwaysis]